MKLTIPENKVEWLSHHADHAAIFITMSGFVARLWMASGTFLNPDEALHFRLANQLSLAEAYRTSLTASHPPLLTLILYFWRIGGTSELWLRMPLVTAGVVFCWMFYKWLANAAGYLCGLIGLLFVALLPPMVALSAEIRQYSLLLAFLASAICFLDEALAKNSAGRMVAFSVFLYLAMLSHYSAFLFAVALGIYVLARVWFESSSIALIVSWATGQLIGLALALFLYRAHIAKLGLGESRTALQGWMSDFFLSRSYFDPSRDHAVTFLMGHSFGVFQFIFGQLAVGVLAGVLFVVGVVLTLRGRDSSKQRVSTRRFRVFLLLPFVIASIASMAHVYPYGGTRHVAFLIIPAIGGVSVAIAEIAGERSVRGIGIATAILVASIAFGKARQPVIDRADQNREQMAKALEFVAATVEPSQAESSDVIFTDYESDLILGHYLCQQRPISFETSNPEYEAFTCGRRVISAGYRAGTLFTPNNFVPLWNSLVTAYHLKPGQRIWIFQAGWSVSLPDQLRKEFQEFHTLRVNSFGNNIKLFELTVGQSMPSVESSSRP